MSYKSILFDEIQNWRSPRISRTCFIRTESSVVHGHLYICSFIHFIFSDLSVITLILIIRLNISRLLKDLISNSVVIFNLYKWNWTFFCFLYSFHCLTRTVDDVNNVKVIRLFIKGKIPIVLKNVQIWFLMFIDCSYPQLQ